VRDFPLLALVVGLAFPSFVQAQQNASVGSSRQITVISEDPALRLKAVTSAESLKGDVLKLLRLNDEWQYPLIINFPPPGRRVPRQPIQSGIYEADDGSLKIQIDVHDPQLVETDAFREAVLGGVLIEMIYRGSTLRAGRNFHRPPSWVVDGLMAEMQSRGRTGQIELAEALIQQKTPPQIQQFLREQTPSSAVDRARRRVGAQALLRALADTPERNAGLMAMLRGVPSERDPLKLIFASFGSLNNDIERLNRLWNLTLARMALPSRTEMLSATQTSAELRKILSVEAPPDPKDPEAAVLSGPPALPALARETYGRNRLTQLANALLTLELRAHPVYRPLVADYREVIQQLASRPRARVDRRLDQAGELWLALDTRLGEMEDYLNWFEINKVSAPDTDFALMLEYQTEIMSPPPRQDAITRYLDRLEANY